MKQFTKDRIRKISLLLLVHIILVIILSKVIIFIPVLSHYFILPLFIAFIFYTKEVFLREHDFYFPQANWLYFGCIFWLLFLVYVPKNFENYYKVFIISMLLGIVFGCIFSFQRMNRLFPDDKNLGLKNRKKKKTHIT